MNNLIDNIKNNFTNQISILSFRDFLISNFNKDEVLKIKKSQKYLFNDDLDLKNLVIYKNLDKSFIYNLNHQFYIFCMNPFDDLFINEKQHYSLLNPLIVLCSSDFFDTLKSQNIKKAEKQELIIQDTNLNFATTILDELFQFAIVNRSSDIHFESTKNGLQIKLRVDGVMIPHQIIEDIKNSRQIISRLKVLSLLDITEQRIPQDGRFRWDSIDEQQIDFRISVIPSIHGEDAVLRILDKSHLWKHESKASLDSLGIDVSSLLTIRNLVKRPYGMLLVTGPTGSGKTTTVYGALAEINTGTDKIITIEDPVEYEMHGVLQIPVNEKKGLTFATGLRSILRHDPDKILIGEIRDAETAQIAVQSALTGHVVFTTVHANSFIDVLGRFQHFNIDPFSFASAINGVVVQRLLRVLCSKCKIKSQKHLEIGFNNSKINLAGHYLAVGCEYCHFTGYKGRIAVAETHFITDEIRDILIDKPSISNLKKIIYKDNTETLIHKALMLVKNGVTTYEEFERIVGLH